MSKNHPIWSIGLFERLSEIKDKAKCLECSKNKADGSEFILTLCDSSVKSLITHLKSKTHVRSDYAKKYDELMDTKKNLSSHSQPGS